MNEQPSLNKETNIDWPRHLARLSILSSVVCFMLQAVVAQLTAKDHPGQRTTIDQVSDAAGLALLVIGVVLALIALAGSIRRRTYDTGVMAVIGLALNGGILAFIAWWVLAIRPGLAA